MNNKPLFSFVWVGALIGTFLLGCYKMNSPKRSNQASELPRNGQAANENNANRELLTLAKDFATSDAQKRDVAWKTLSSYERSDLIKSLLALRNNDAKNEPDRLAIAFLLCNLDFDYNANKEIIVTTLTGERRYPDTYSDWETELLGRLIQSGDKNLLPVLFSIVKRSDGGWSEELSGIFERELTSSPEAFLLQLRSVPRRTRQEVYRIFPRDIAYENTSKIKAYLRSVPSHSAKGQVAKELLRELADAEMRIRKGEN